MLKSPGNRAGALGMFGAGPFFAGLLSFVCVIGASASLIFWLLNQDGLLAPFELSQALVWSWGLPVLFSILAAMIIARQPQNRVGWLLIAALFAPLRRRVQAFIDRRFYRQKYDAQQVLAQFAQTARDEVAMEALTAELTHVIQETIQPTQIAIWLKQVPR